MTADNALKLAASLEAAKSALEADYPELRMELDRDVFRGNELRNLTDKVVFYTGPDCFAAPARKSAGLAEAIAGLLSMKTRVVGFDGEAILAESAAKKATSDAKSAADSAAFWADYTAKAAEADERRRASDAAAADRMADIRASRFND